MATAPKSKNYAVVERFYKVLSVGTPPESLLTAETARIDAGTATLGELLKGIYTSPTVGNGLADDLARMFFIAFGRPPDFALFSAGMQALRAGASMADISNVALSFPGLPLSSNGFPNHRDFVNALIARVLGNDFPLVQELAEDLTNGLSSGAFSRGYLLGLASGLRNVASATETEVESALLYLAGAGREVSKLEMANTADTMEGRIIDALSAGGLSATAGKTAMTRDGSSVYLYSDLPSDFLWDAANDVYKLGGSKVFKVYYSNDKGFSGAQLSFSTDLAVDVNRLDARDLVGKGKFTFVANPTIPSTFMAPESGSTVTGSAGSDTLMGNIGADVFYATGGQDTVTGGLGDDRFILGTSNLYQSAPSGGNAINITDFGNGKDVLDFSRLLGAQFDVAKLKVTLANDSTLKPIVNGSVTLVENNGVWTTGGGTSQTSRPATEADVALLFQDQVFAKPATGKGVVFKSVVITADTRNSADVWLVLNSVSPDEVTDGFNGPQEIFKVAHLDGAWNATLVGLQPALL